MVYMRRDSLHRRIGQRTRRKGRVMLGAEGRNEAKLCFAESSSTPQPAPTSDVDVSEGNTGAQAQPSSHRQVELHQTDSDSACWTFLNEKNVRRAITLVIALGLFEIIIFAVFGSGDLFSANNGTTFNFLWIIMPFVIGIAAKKRPQYLIYSL
eukprot:768697-Hanusia_phi.AAC.8